MEPIGYNKKRASEVLDRRGIDVLIASTGVNVFYTTGLPTLHVAHNPILWVLKNQFPYVALVRRNGELSLFYWMVFASLDRFSWVKDATGVLSPEQTVKSIGKKLADWGSDSGTVIGVESHMPRYQADYLRSNLPGVEFVNADDAFLEMRLIKTVEEISRIRRSTEISERAIQAMIDEAHVGITDFELLKIARRTIIESGAEGWDHLTIGIGSSDPEAPGVGTVMAAGELTRLDIGAVWKGYVSDVSRELVLHTVPDGAEEVMERMIRVQDFCADQIAPGVLPGDVYKAAIKFHKTLSSTRPAITCHSIGLECEEAHLFSRMRRAEFPFEENMVVDIEVWQSFRDSGLVGIEDCYRITASGCERLSTLDRGIFVK
ncbi:MAG: M24 family metallopeptidase [Candidatus Sifarchaeia archaeon]